MDQNYVFMTDSDSDLPFHLKQEYDIPVVYMPYALDGKEYFDDLGQMLDHKSYYDMMRNGATPVTSALKLVPSIVVTRAVARWLPSAVHLTYTFSPLWTSAAWGVFA